MCATASRSGPWRIEATWNATDQAPARAIAWRDAVSALTASTTPAAATPRATACRPTGSGRLARCHARQRLCPALSAESVFELHLFSGRPGERRSVRAGRSPLGRRRPPDASPAGHARWPARRARGSAPTCAATPSARSGCTGRWHAPAEHGSRGCGRAVIGGGLSSSTRCSGRRGRAPALGVRGDRYWFDVDAGNPAQRRLAVSGPGQPEGCDCSGSLANTELYVNAGTGFHSNDARGTTITVDPVSGDPVERVTPLVRARGAEVGLRSMPWRGFQTTVAAWTLALDSELLFVGDAGTTDAGRPSRRYGVELTALYSPRAWLMFDADVVAVACALPRRRPNRPSHPWCAGAAWWPAAPPSTMPGGVGGSLRVRHFGPRDLIEDGAVRSRATTLGERPARDPGSASREGRVRRVQSLRREGQRHRLLLHLALARRACQRRCGRALASCVAAQPACRLAVWILATRDQGHTSRDTSWRPS